jgi:hypothetical protein
METILHIDVSNHKRYSYICIKINIRSEEVWAIGAKLHAVIISELLPSKLPYSEINIPYYSLVMTKDVPKAGVITLEKRDVPLLQ